MFSLSCGVKILVFFFFGCRSLCNGTMGQWRLMFLNPNLGYDEPLKIAKIHVRVPFL
jgi:hypothetical protein